MNDRVDHAAEAREWLAKAQDLAATEDHPSLERLAEDRLRYAQIEATIAVAYALGDVAAALRRVEKGD